VHLGKGKGEGLGSGGLGLGEEGEFKRKRGKGQRVDTGKVPLLRPVPGIVDNVIHQKEDKDKDQRKKWPSQRNAFSEIGCYLAERLTDLGQDDVRKTACFHLYIKGPSSGGHKASGAGKDEKYGELWAGAQAKRWGGCGLR